ncbi:alpha-beta hydrolase superfamily lysophospholipase [Kitasatospora sp. SolWspMP-SS2h]|uniref:alpha/beta fold hydrolase n=1 Tax=Kitasatospora sp. SolWspMP-SS2h TaxID=1305729 RepID=UPI000DB97A55|nr:alpha/beta hydrolase [Kitasatospora sp. SolWspMP-SS2h]RAJ38679.1 alpha-beta hydrolase superfamily lysophospholipase [Kitasatospora sp. SolWspMP-SS2h]
MAATALLRTALNATSLVATAPPGRVAYELFRRPLRRSRVRTAERELHDRATTEELTVNGKRVRAYRWGDGRRPVLLVHGWQSRASRFAPYVRGLLDLGMSPVAFDAPGHGDSAGRATTILEYRELIGRLAERHGPFEGAVAHSFGVCCTFLAMAEGVPVGRLVAVAGVAEFGFLVEGFAAGLGLNDRLRADLARRVEQVLLPDAGDVRRRFDATHRPERVGAPILVVHDEGDEVVPLRQAHLLRAAYGEEQLRLITTRGLGHRRVLSEPTVVDNALAFLAEPLPTPLPAPVSAPLPVPPTAPAA